MAPNNSSTGMYKMILLLWPCPQVFNVAKLGMKPISLEEGEFQLTMCV